MFTQGPRPKRADKELLWAVLEPRKPGALQRIADGCAAGADPNGTCPDTSTARGPVRGGRTLLTHAISEESADTVQKLLECGADPNRADEHGWTPWIASTLIDESKRQRIQDSLRAHGAQADGERIGELARAIFAGDLERTKGLIQSERDLEILATFRVDLVGRHVASGHTAMLELLLDAGMPLQTTHLVNAIRSGNAAAVDQLLRHGLPPEQPDEVETPLMTAAGMGKLEIVERLVEAGADVNRAADEDGEWTASHYARQSGHVGVVDWLVARMDEAVVEEHKQRMARRNPKFRLLYEQGAAGDGASTDDIVAALVRWDEQFGIEVTEAAYNRVRLVFGELPDRGDRLYGEILELCPDAADSEADLEETLRENATLSLWWD